MKSAPFALFALIVLAAVAPIASADGGTLVVDNTDFTVNSYTLTSNHLDADVNSGVLGDWFFFVPIRNSLRLYVEVTILTPAPICSVIPPSDPPQ